MLFSLGCATGCIATIASYNKFNHKVLRDAIICTVMDSLISILAGFVVFAYLGFIARKSEHAHVDDFKSLLSNGRPYGNGNGQYMPLIAFPQIIAEMDFCPQLTIVFLCLTVVTLALGTMLMYVETVITAILDHFPVCMSRLSKCVCCVISI